MFVPDFPVGKLQGVEYNPRRIDPSSSETLRESIRSLGFCKPLLVTEGGRIVAGHQRTSAARALGIDTVPAFVLGDLGLETEMKLNQIHNGADIDSVRAEVRVPAMRGVVGFQEVQTGAIVGDWKQPGAMLRKEIYRLISRFGAWGCAIVSESGEVLSSGHYALASRQALRPLRVYVVPDEKRADVARFFGLTYGEFDYSKLPRHTFVQAFAQPNRHNDGDGLSALYRCALRDAKPGERIFDFGSGQGFSAAKARSLGHNVVDVELFYRGTVVSRSIKPKRVHEMIDALCASLSAHGLFDVVIGDSVINSVDSVDAEGDVMACLNAFCKPGGRIYFSGRSRERAERNLEKNTAVDRHGSRRGFEFFDANGFTTVPRGELWFFQKYHTKAEANGLATTYVGPDFEIRAGACWQAWGTKAIEVSEARKRTAIEREFDLPWPSGHRVGRSAQVLSAYDAAPKA